MPGFRIANLDAIDAVEDHGLPIDAARRPVRHHLGVEAFGLNAKPGETFRPSDWETRRMGG